MAKTPPKPVRDIIENPEVQRLAAEARQRLDREHQSVVLARLCWAIAEIVELEIWKYISHAIKILLRDKFKPKCRNADLYIPSVFTYRGKMGLIWHRSHLTTPNVSESATPIPSHSDVVIAWVENWHCSGASACLLSHLPGFLRVTIGMVSSYLSMRGSRKRSRQVRNRGTTSKVRSGHFALTKTHPKKVVESVEGAGNMDAAKWSTRLKSTDSNGRSSII